jgi:hypothetical protein
MRLSRVDRIVEALMKLMVVRSILFSVLMVLLEAVQAQGVYVTHGPNGPVFSDKPRPGAKEVTLQPLTVVPPPSRSPSSSPSASSEAPSATPAPKSDKVQPDAAPSAYRRFSIVSPENDGSVVANTAVFEVRVAVDPPLQLGEGHSFVVRINGRTVDERFTATEFMIPPEFWGEALPPPNQSVQLDASIVDGNGQVLKQAIPVRFFMRHATVYNHPRRFPPPLPPNSPPKPAIVKPKPAPESAGVMTKPSDK